MSQHFVIYEGFSVNVTTPFKDSSQHTARRGSIVHPRPPPRGLGASLYLLSPPSYWKHHFSLPRSIIRKRRLRRLLKPHSCTLFLLSVYSVSSVLKSNSSLYCLLSPLVSIAYKTKTKKSRDREKITCVTCPTSRVIVDKPLTSSSESTMSKSKKIIVPFALLGHELHGTFEFITYIESSLREPTDPISSLKEDAEVFLTEQHRESKIVQRLRIFRVCPPVSWIAIPTHIFRSLKMREGVGLTT